MLGRRFSSRKSSIRVEQNDFGDPKLVKMIDYDLGVAVALEGIKDLRDYYDFASERFTKRLDSGRIAEEIPNGRLNFNFSVGGPKRGRFDRRRYGTCTIRLRDSLCAMYARVPHFTRSRLSPYQLSLIFSLTSQQAI